MTKTLSWAFIAAALLIFWQTDKVYAKLSVEAPTVNAPHRTHESLVQKTGNHRAHHHNHHKSQFLTQPQAQRRQLQQHVLPFDTFSPTAAVSANVHNKTRSTRLRRLNTREYRDYAQRRLRNHRSNSDWNYHVYNVQSNTFESPSSPGSVVVAGGSGKGDDNTADVEFISQSGTGLSGGPSWVNNRRSFGFLPSHTTSAPPTANPPPPLVPARRGYVTAAPPGVVNSDLPQATDEPNETNNFDSKEMEKRHLCVQQRTITTPVKTTEVYTRPIWKHVNTPCSAVQVPTQHPNQMCTRVQLVHEQSFRDVIRHKSAQQITYDCCNGWEREEPKSESCSKPICSAHCQNGGICTSPDTCSCAAGFTGKYCEHDINECNEEKPCDQTCINTVGSYFCKCREGFVLQADQQSCKKSDLKDDDAFEARDLENEIESGDNEDVSDRLQKLERSLANERVHTNELQKSLQATYNVVDTLKSRLSTILANSEPVLLNVKVKVNLSRNVVQMFHLPPPEAPI
ncbi:uncharacterized protein LOC101460923 [Ceratitis capitata]|uniref:uncharacterized protein LOC101460923 n=1 Tax=Ceratitis capitata TaxID=7213 RepID=UPI000A11EFFF|nr:uncharacterized protein LOC101460923 [Ceratitis capitata]